MFGDDISSDLLLHPALDRVLSTLANRHRRLILLLMKDGKVETEADVMVRSTTEDQTSEIALRHNHLPRLHEAGYIDWDRESGELSRGPRFEEVEAFLELIERHADELPPDWP